MKLQTKRILILVICFTLLSCSAVFANSEKDKSISTDRSGEIVDLPPEVEILDVDEEIIKLQREIDQYLFEEHREEIRSKGFIVTHTVPLEDCVEIGITPYNDENARYLNDIFGVDKVKIIEGQQAETYDIAVDSDEDVEIDLVSANETEEDIAASNEEPESNSSKLPWILAAGVLIIVLSFIIKRKGHR